MIGSVSRGIAATTRTMSRLPQTEPLMQPDRRLGAAMREMARGIRLHRGLQQRPFAAQTVGHPRVVHLGQMRLHVRFEKAEAALIGARRSEEAMLRQTPPR